MNSLTNTRTCNKKMSLRCFFNVKSTKSELFLSVYLNNNSHLRFETKI